ncbi:MAG: hypothetical protein IJZ42_13350 [Lachnospiraceae bacterium]|nr:hypothetical protein [Lachnospiraceae bacterium]
MLFIAEDERENELAQKLAKEYGGTAYERQDAYGVTVWSVQDVMAEHPNLTDEAAARFLEAHEHRLRENSIAGGWDFIDNADYSEFKSNFIEYKGLKIFEQDGLYTVGGQDNASFDDCTLENLSLDVDEGKLVEYCLENGIGVAFNDLRDDNKSVSYERYKEHLARYDVDPDCHFLDEEFIVPSVVFFSLEETKDFVDLLDNLSLSQRIENLREQATALGGTLHFSENDIIDAQHLNCFWYDSGSIAVFEYKGFDCSIEVQGDISLAAFAEDRETQILAFGKRNGQPAYKDDEVLAVIRDDAGLQTLAEQNRLYFTLNNWVEFRIFDENDNEISLHQDNVLEDNLLEAIDGLSDYAAIIDEIIQQRETGKDSLDEKIKNASQRSNEATEHTINEKEQIK